MAIQFQMLVTQISILMSESENTQRSITELLIDLNHGRINPALLTPLQLSEELMRIKEKLPAKLQIPGHQSDSQLRDVYNLMEARGIIIDQKLIIKGEIPLMQSESSEVFKLVAIPSEYKRRVVKAKLRNEFLIYNFGLNSYFFISQAQLNRCTRSLNKHLICKGKTPWQPALDQTCELSALFNTSHADCQYEETKKTPFWAELNPDNTWIFKVFKRSTLHVDCLGGKREIIEIPAQGVLSIEAGCTARYEGITLSSHQIFTTQNTISLIQDPIISVIHDITEDKIVPLQIDRINNNKDVEQIKEQINRISNNDFNLRDLNLKNHSGHISLILVIIIIVILFICYVRYKSKPKGKITINLSNRTNT
ncbi:uncharacterized protein LOC126766607 [Bactrocera neohumeralis]|uniref:uncharacterized protein LOC126766607 n=1 Tax=Bactrocera neohumeralis TaxID=98809 RepID=UPI0021656969|nr:uncharacterized protein LOC126766607 [Bactrocera neohumeralis]